MPRRGGRRGAAGPRLVDDQPYWATRVGLFAKKGAYEEARRANEIALDENALSIGFAPAQQPATGDRIGFGGGLQCLPALDLLNRTLSTNRRQPGIVVNVHPVPSGSEALQAQSPRSGPDGQPNESSYLVNAGHRPALASPRPRQQVGTVGVDAGGELRVVDELARRAEFREVWQRAPANDEVAPVGRLGVALRRRA